MGKSLRVTSTQPNTAVLTHSVSSQNKSSWLKPLEKQRFHRKISFQIEVEYTNLPSLLVTKAFIHNVCQKTRPLPHQRATETYSALSGSCILNSFSYEWTSVLHTSQNRETKKSKRNPGVLQKLSISTQLSIQVFLPLAIDTKQTHGCTEQQQIISS